MYLNRCRHAFWVGDRFRPGSVPVPSPSPSSTGGISKFKTARSRLYQNEMFQVSIRWKALDEIYKIYMLLHRSDLNISEFFVKLFRIFRQNFPNLNFVIFEFFTVIVAQILMKFYRNFANIEYFRKY